MAQDDFYLQAGSQRLAQIEAERAAALADLAAHKANHDQDSAAASIQQIANLDVELRNLNDLYTQYVRSQNPPKPPEPTLEERRAKPWEKMDYSDVWEMSKSKYGPPDEAGRSYPLSIGGLSYGFTFGASETRLHGTVTNIQRPSDINGVYGQGGGAAVIKGAQGVVLANQNGAVLTLAGEQTGLIVSLDLSGLVLTLK